MSPIVLAILAGSAFLVNGVLLQSRAPQTAAVCTPDFAWTDNAEKNSPCLVVAEIDSICNNGNWVIKALATNNSNKYDIPVGPTATLCTCSWASYNLISACTACQGANLASQIPYWGDYSSNCAGKLSTSYFPGNITLPADVSIPFWAGKDPSTWPNGLFSVSDAQQIANQHNPDLGAVPPAHKKSSIGPIVGGVIGGLVIVAVAALIAFYILRRQRQLANSGPSLSMNGRPPHIRSTSDVTTKSGFQEYTTLSSTPINRTTSPTIMTHNTSVRSLPWASSVVTSTVPYSTASPPPGLQTTSPPPGNREDIVEPFVLAPSNAYSGDRKQPNFGYPVYDSPTAPPPSAMRMGITRPVTPTQRARFNPPAYTPSSPGTSSPSRPPHRGKQASTDTLTSSHGHRPTADHNPNSSGSGMPNLVGQMGSTNTPHNEGGSGRPQGHGRQNSAPRDEKSRLTYGSVDGRELA